MRAERVRDTSTTATKVSLHSEMFVFGIPTRESDDENKENRFCPLCRYVTLRRLHNLCQFIEEGALEREMMMQCELS